MNHMHHYHQNQPSPLEIRQLAEFDAALGEAPEAEQRRKRTVYLRDALDYWGIQRDEILGEESDDGLYRH